MLQTKFELGVVFEEDPRTKLLPKATVPYPQLAAELLTEARALLLNAQANRGFGAIASPYQAQQAKKKYNCLLNDRRLALAATKVADHFLHRSGPSFVYQIRNLAMLRWVQDTEWDEAKFSPRTKGRRWFPISNDRDSYHIMQAYLFPYLTDAEERARQLQFVKFDLKASPPAWDHATHPELATRMVDLAKIEEWNLVLDGTAGQGDIAYSLLKGSKHSIPIPKSGMLLLERDHLLAKKLSLEGFYCIETRLQEYDRVGLHDRVIMHPSVLAHEDEAAVRHAYTLLAMDGRLVSVITDLHFTQKTQRARAFCKWLTEEVHAAITPIPDLWYPQRKPHGVRQMLITTIEKAEK